MGVCPWGLDALSPLCWFSVHCWIPTNDLRITQNLPLTTMDCFLHIGKNLMTIFLLLFGIKICLSRSQKLKLEMSFLWHLLYDRKSFCAVWTLSTGRRYDGTCLEMMGWAPWECLRSHLCLSSKITKIQKYKISTVLLKLNKIGICKSTILQT